MKKVIVVLAAIIFFLLVKSGVESYVSRAPDYPDGPTVNGLDLYTNNLTSTFYTSASMDEDSLFSGTSIRFHENGKLLVKAGIENGKLHGPFDSWYDNGQKQVSILWKNGTHCEFLGAYYPNGDPILGSPQEIAEIVFGDLIMIQP
jgi:hypothetical protein|tara:strand:- start:5619 stop:6056 length:438 start_codon:yes stop_codon:yes gene_type:complete